MSQPVSAKPETLTTPATKKAEPKTSPTKAEPTPAATKPQPTPAPIKAVPTVPTPKAKMEPTAVSAQIEIETTRIPTTAKVSSVTAVKQPLAESTAEPILPTMATVQQKAVTPKVDMPNIDVPKTETVETREEAVKVEPGPELPKVKADAGVAAASSFPVTEPTVVPTSPLAAEVAVDGVVPGTETKPELSAAPEMIIMKVQPDDHIKPTEPTKVEVQPKSQEPQLVLGVEPVIAADSKEIADKLVEKITDITSTPEIQPVSTKSIIIKVRIGPLD